MNPTQFQRAAQQRGLPFEPLTDGVRIGNVTVTLIPAEGFPGCRFVYQIGKTYATNQAEAVREAVRLAKLSKVNVQVDKPVETNTFHVEHSFHRTTDKDLLEMYPPRTVRQCVLHYLATGNGFQRSDVIRHVFGSHLKTGTRGDVQPVFWKQHTENSMPFDQFSEFVAEDLGLDTGDMNAWRAGDFEGEILHEICDVLSSQPTSKTAREMLADEYRKYDSQAYFDLPESIEEAIIPF